MSTRKTRRSTEESKAVLRLETLEPRAMLSADATLFVDGVYNKLLSRAADEGGAQYWSGLLANGVSREEIVLGVQASNEFRASQLSADCGSFESNALIEHFYASFLHRAADAGGLDYWVSKLDADGVERVIAGILGSTEGSQLIEDDSASDTIAFDSGVQALAGVPSIVGAPEFSQITPSAQLYLPGVPYGRTAISNATQQNSIVIASGKLFVAYYDQANRLTLRRRDIATGVWSNPITFTQTVTGNDAHKTPNIGVSPDGRIHLVYGQNLSPLRYQFSTTGTATVSDTNFTLARFTSGERNYLVSGQPILELSYPMFINQESTGIMMMMWREHAGGSARHSYMASYNFDGSGNWGGKRKIIDGLIGTYDDPADTLPASTDRNAYYNDVITFGNEVHITWTWREDATTADSNHDLMYAKSTDRGLTWTNAAGTVVGNPGAGVFMNVNSPITVTTVNGAPFHLGQNWDLINQNTSYVDSQGNTHVVLRHAESATNTTQRYFHYVRTGTTWTQTMLPFAAGYRPKMFIDRVTDTVYVTAVVGGYLRIFAAQKGTNDWGTWNQIYTTTTVQYVNDGMNGRMSADGRTLWMLGQRKGASDTSTSSRLETIKFTLNPNV